MNKQGFIIFGIILLILGGFTVYGVQYRAEREKELAAFDKKMTAVMEEKRKQDEIEKKEQEAKEEADKKAVFEKHKGEQLVYFPMGDSLAEGSYASEENKKYVSVLEQLLEENMGYDVQIKEGAAISGTGISDNGIPNAPKVVNESPNLITIEFGTNDLNKELKSYSKPEDFQNRLTELIDYLQTNSSKPPRIILITTWKSGNDSIVYDNIIGKVGKENNVPVANIQSVWKGRSDTSGPAGENTYRGLRDNWHPNDLGHKEIAEITYKTAYELLK